jgi:hypothetical protein
VGLALAKRAANSRHARIMEAMPPGDLAVDDK